MSQKKWFRLDNSAKLYPFITTKDTQNLFRFTVELSSDIDKDIMQSALDTTLKRFPSFAVRLRRGAFWYYLEENNKQLKITDEDDILMQQINATNCDGFCFRVMCHRNRLSLEFFHILCDGSGALQFIKSLIFHYLQLKGCDVAAEGKVITSDTPIDPAEYEDSFLKNYKPIKLKDLDIKSMTGSKNKAFTLPGKQFDHLGKGAITLDLDASKVLAYCKSKGCTVTHFLGGLFIYSVYMTKVKNNKNLKLKKPTDITLFIPINLRKLYGSKTLRNFTLFSRARQSINQPDLTLDDCIKCIQDSIEKCYNKPYLDANISTAMKGEKFWPVRLLPLWLKHLIFAINNEKTLKTPTKTATFSNIGVADLPESFRPYVQKINFMLHACPSVPMSFTAITTYDTLSIAFVRLLYDTDVEQFFAAYLADLGFDVVVGSNFWEVDYAL